MLRRGSPTGFRALRLPLGPRAEPGSARASGPLSAVLVVCAVAVAVAPLPHWAAAGWRAAAAMTLVALGAAIHLVLGARRRPPRGWLVVDDAGVRRIERGRTTEIVDWREPLGVTVLASTDRSTWLVALTSPHATRYLSARVRDAEDAGAAPAMIERATTAADSDLRAGDESALCAADAERLIAEVVRRSPGALDRAYLSDALGEPIVLDRAELRVGQRRIDLSAALEWRALYFQERGAHAASVSQATWVRQGDVELVLVAPVAGYGALPGDGHDARGPGLVLHAAAQISVARDLRLMEASPGEPPPRELRHAIDRVFMLPLRRALDRAPRISRVPSSPRPMPEGRA